MDRRLFLNLLGKGLLVSSTLGISPPLVWGKTSFDYALEGQNLIQRGDYNNALKALKEAVRLDPDSDWAFGLLGRAYRGLGRKAEAVDTFRQAVRLNPEDVYSRMMIEIMTQKPIPKLPRAKKPLSPLEKKAREEEAQMLNRLRSEAGLKYQVKRVVIDAGHGGFDSGAVGMTGLKEKDVTLDLAKRFHRRLQGRGEIKSFLTRTGDYYVPLSERTVIANQYQADLFVSIHINANKKREAHGSETYFCAEKASSKEAARVASFENAVLKYDKPFKKRRGYIDIEEILFQFERKLYWSESDKFAHRFQKRFKQGLPLHSRGVHSANFYVLRRAKMPSILLETGFISNPRNESMLRQDTFREKIVDAIIRGLA
jgi:N-acetylmuramoyl-L-alanine amidase